MRHLPSFVAVFVLVASSAFAQSPPDSGVALENTPVYVAPDASRTPLRVAAQGTVFKVLGEEGEWTRVQFNDPQWGPRVGYVQTRTLRISRPDLEPMDLSVREPVPPARRSPQFEPVPPALGNDVETQYPMPVRFERSPWPRSYVVGRGGITFGTRTAPMAGIEVGGQVAPILQVYGSFDWHRDVAPSYLGEIAEATSEIYDVDVDARLPAYVATGGIKVIAPRGALRPYALGGFGVARVQGTIEVEGEDVTALLDGLGVLDRDDLQATKPTFEIGGGVALASGPVYIDLSYRFRKPFDVAEPFNVSGIYLGAGVGF